MTSKDLMGRYDMHKLIFIAGGFSELSNSVNEYFDELKEGEEKCAKIKSIKKLGFSQSDSEKIAETGSIEDCNARVSDLKSALDELEKHQAISVSKLHFSDVSARNYRRQKNHKSRFKNQRK